MGSPNPNDPPLFVVRIMENGQGHRGPILCWPDGEIVPGQCDTQLRLPATGIPTVTVCLFVGTGVVEIEDDPPREALPELLPEKIPLPS